MKPRLSFYTNMPTPYQLDFLSALKDYFDLYVVYYTTRETDRQWTLPTSGEGYQVQVLHNNFIARFLQTWFPSFHFSWQILSTIRHRKAELLIVNGTYWSPNVLLALFFGRQSHTKVSYWAEPVFPVTGIRFQIKRIMLWPVRRYTDFLLAIGIKAKLGYQEYGYNKPIFNFPYNINVEAFRKEHLDKNVFASLLREYKSQDETVLLTSGSLVKRKGIDTVIKAFQEIPLELNARLIIVGDGEEKQALQLLAATDPRIHFVGFQEKNLIPYWFNLADIFVFASRYDGWGLVINEAVAAGLAVICSNTVGAATDKLVDGVNCFLLHPEDVVGYAQKMTTLITDPNLRKKFVKQTEAVKIELSSAFSAKTIYGLCSGSE